MEYADNDLPSAAEQGIGALYFSDLGLTAPYNPQSYQLISPGGRDFDYGSGGYYNGQASTGAYDRDNITNFKKGRLN
ncbi:MAG: hypothetical protein U0992_04170 [Planctomycetaceae bacterium]